MPPSHAAAEAVSPSARSNKFLTNRRPAAAAKSRLRLGIIFVLSGLMFWYSLEIIPNPEKNTAFLESLASFKSPELLTTKEVVPPNEDDTLYIDVVKEDPIANPPLPNGNETFSACLLVMDDNHRLVEWLAYHAHVLPLGYLIVAVDPRSRTSPTHVLNRWRGKGIMIEEWSDMDYLKPELASRPVSDDAKLNIKRDRHRMRQKNFYQACLKRSKELQRTWVTLIDTDEFLMYNHKGGKDFEAWEARETKRLKESKYSNKVRIKPSQAPPTPADEGAVIRYIRQEQDAGHPFFQKSCISIPRLQFGATESTVEERDSGVIDKGAIDTDSLDTLRYRKHAHRQDFVKNGLSKCILDVSRIENFPRITTLHRPIKTICAAPWKDDWDSGLRINHYLGSWEAYSFRDDSRRGGERSYEGWAFKAQDADETDDNIRPWINGFLEKYGSPQAKYLLKGAGLPRGYQSKGASKNWTIVFLADILSVNETKGNDNRVAFDDFVRDIHKNKE